MMKLPTNGKVTQLKVLVAQKVAELGAPWGLYAERLSPSCVSVLSSIRCTFLMPEIPRVRVSSRTAASREQNPPRRIHLTAATLLVCPDSLPFQWLTETKKHTENLKVIHISSVEKIPDLETVLDADLVIVTNSVLKEVFSNRSHIRDIRWKRLIVDEGHVVGNNNSILDICGQEWIAECRWVVSGTPTAGLTRLDTKSLFDHKSDLQKLGRIMGEFLKIEPWASNPSSWQQSVVKPLLSSRYDGFEHAVRVLSGVLVRHRIEDVEQSTRLPPLYHNVVFLEPSFYDRIVANLYLSNVLLQNLLDPKKFGLRNYLRRLRSAFFVSTNYETRDIQFFFDELSAYIFDNQTALTGPGGEKGLQLVRKIYMGLHYAASADNWRTVSHTQEMPFFIQDTTRHSRPFQMAVPVVAQNKQEYAIIGGAQLNYLQKAAGKVDKLDLWTDTKSKDGTPLEGVAEEMNDDPLFSKRYWERYHRMAFNKREKKDKKNPPAKSFHQFDQKILPAMFLDSQGFEVDTVDGGAPQRHHSQLEKKEKEEKEKEEKQKQKEEEKDNTVIAGTGSTKLSYLVSKTLSLVDQHKILVFYEDVDSALAVTEAFEAAGIRHLIYTTDSVSKERRAQYLASFETSNYFRVLLMSINAAAHGLNITSASWVFFLSPVWRRDIEAQAIKRAHRIGQKSEVHVETLVLKDTLEEEIYRRRTEILDSNDETPKEMADDDQLRSTILNYPLTSMDSFSKGTTDEVAFFDHPVPLYVDTETHEQFEKELVQFEGISGKKKRKKTVVEDGFAKRVKVKEEGKK
ncbi:putative ATP-dependent helicase C23E6.02 [Yarrowia sp. E02]|nr:putative ATP-dependent helicase C23E6.02 [Yarrowia sp. E02]